MIRRNLSFFPPLAAAFLVMLSAAASGRSQTAAPQPGDTVMVLKGKAPVSHDVLKIKLPKPGETDLPNGLHLMVLEDHRLPQIGVQIIISGAGGFYDPAGRFGLAQYTAQMMREGTSTRTTLQIAQELETIAATVNSAAGFSSPNATVSASALTENFDHAFDIAADVLLHPVFPVEEWDRARARAKAGLQQQRTSPNFLATEMYTRLIYGDHPAGRISATASSLDAISRESMVEFHHAHYVPDHALIAFAGDITLADARKKVEAKLGGWNKTGIGKPAIAQPAAPVASKVTLIARPNSVQTLLMVGGPAIVRTDPDYEALTVANRVLGGVMGRLFRHLREEKGYTYGIGSSFSAQNYRGDWQASTSVRTAVTEPALTDLLAELAEMRDRPVPAAEFEDAKRSIVAVFALSLENANAVLNYYVQSWLFGLPADYWDTYAARISAVTPDQARAMAKKYWDASRLQIVAVGDAPQISAILKKKGTLEVFDADGKPVPPGN
jgi:zinc protease